MRRVFLLTVLAALVAVPSAAAAPPVFWVSGHGWGHGIGMPQYGAYGYARDEGKKHAWILAHYYKGTTLGNAPISTVRVLLTEGRASIKVGSTGPFTATDARGRTFAFPAKTLTLGPGLKVTVGGRERTLASPVTFKRGSRNLQLGGHAYRGKLVVRSNGSKINVVNSVSLEQYLFGVVPDEMPPSWSPEALKAQAVAARSYAVVSRKTSGNFDLYDDTRSQVYGGVPSEDARTTAAIQATAGKVVKYNGAVAWTFFHSTSGGRTAAIQHVWNAAPIPYLVSVSDPHDTISPYHNWGAFRFSATQLKTSLGSLAPAGALRDATVARNASQRVDTVTFRGNGGTKQAGGTSVQSRLGLRSSWFAITVLQLGGPTTSTPGKRQTLTGIARGFGSVWLEKKIGSGAWTKVRDLTPQAGKVQTTVRPRVTTWFRLGSPRGPSPAHRIKITTAASVRAAALGALLAPVIRLLAVLVLAGAFAGPAAAGTIVVGVEDGASEAALADAVEATTGGRLVDDLGPLDALVFAVPDDRAADVVASLAGASYAEPIRGGQRRLFFVPNDPLFPAQWHLPAIRAFDHWAVRPPQPAVRVAVIDSGVDGTHPELAGRIAASRTFVGGSALVDDFGHGTIVAGEIAAAIGNGVGVAGAGIPVELLVAKVVGDVGTISILAESRAIRWAVDQGAQVINLSLGGRRDPTRPAVDTYSALEHDAVDYATRHGVVVVAAGGNCVALRCPERYASWPAALPHVIGVGALTPSLAPPAFSNRDRRHIDLAAPGTDIVSLYPTTVVEPGCPTGYTNCPDRLADGTSFASPLAASAAAVLVGERRMLAAPKPHASQTTLVLERSAEDLGPAGRDAASGNGILDVDAALDALGGALPPRDHFEPNDDAGHRAHRLTGRTKALRATLERWEDRRDVYRLPLGVGERLVAFVTGPAGSNVDLRLWRPGTETIGRRVDRVAAAVGPGRNARLVYRAAHTGVYALELRMPTGRGGPYGLTLARR